MGQVGSSRERESAKIEVSSTYNDEGKVFQDLLEEVLLYIIGELD